MPPSRKKSLVELLTSLFTADELRRQATFLSGGELMAALPSGAASLEELAFEMVQALERRGQIDEELFARLEEARPGRRSEIDRVRALILDSMVTAPNEPRSTSTFVEASIAAPRQTQPFAVQTRNGRSVAVWPGFDAAELARLLAVVEKSEC